MSFFSRHKALCAVICIFLIIAAAACAVFGAGYSYLSRISYDDGESEQTAPTVGESQAAEHEAAQQADNEIFAESGMSDSEKNALAAADVKIKKSLESSGSVCYSDDVINILLMGIDYGSSNYPYGRSDAMILLSANTAAKTVKLISLSRTAYCAIPGYRNTRLSHAHGVGGARLAVRAVQENYKIRVDNYVSTNFDSFKKIIDLVGGVSVTLDDREAWALNRNPQWSFPRAGTYTLDGEQALSFARTRDIDTDRERTGRQRRVLTAIYQRVRSLSASELLSLAGELLPLVRTDLTKAEIVRFIPTLLSLASAEISADNVLPHESSGLVLKGRFEVVLVNWSEEVKYAQNLIYGTSERKYE